ncbi:MAG: P-loop NTPase [Hyphomicrobium sp.]
MPLDKQNIIDALKRVKGPDLTSNLVDLGLISEIFIKDKHVYFSITISSERAQELEPLRQAAEKVVADLEGVSGVSVVLTSEKKTLSQSFSGQPNRELARTQDNNGRQRSVETIGETNSLKKMDVKGNPGPQIIPGVKHLIAVASGKGGVGKSTTAVNIALGLKALGLKVGVMDADIYGPSVPRLLGLKGKPQLGKNKKALPMERYGLKAISMGFMVDEDTPIVWRGPMVTQALNQMLREVEWGELDVMVIDMPPGTGDVQLSMAQQVPLVGAVIISTPQDLALIDAKKCLAMFRKVNVPILGIIENMSFYLCPHCGQRSEIFGHGGARDEALKLGVSFLGSIPLHVEIRSRSDTGLPIVATLPDSKESQVYFDVSKNVWEQILRASADIAKTPDFNISPQGDMLSISFDRYEKYVLTAEMLRVLSPSAEVQGHSPQQRVTLGGKRSVRITQLKPVGNYAIRLVFDDHHDTGLYTWDYLRTLGREKDQRWAEYLAELSARGLSRE